MKCPKCGRFVKDAVATFNGFDEIERVDAKCAKHGTIQPNDWEWDDFADREMIPVEIKRKRKIKGK